MRLSPKEIQSFIAALSPFLIHVDAELGLYGSRVDDARKGGDIDLLLLVNTKKTRDQILLNQHKILAAIKKQIGEQKIDLKVATHTEIDTDSFLQSIFSISILLHPWL